MPFTINSPNLPSNVKALDAELKAQWVKVFNSVLADCESEGGEDCEAAAMTQANGVAKARQEESMKFSEVLQIISEASHAAIGALKDLRQELEALELEEDQSGRVMAALELLEQVFAPKDDEDEDKPEHPDDDDDEPMEGTHKPENEHKPKHEAAAATEAFTESLTSGAITILEAEPPESVRDPLLIKMRLIKAGPGNPHDNHYYPGKVLRRDAHVFEGVKLYTTPHNESIRSEENEVGKIRRIVDFEKDGSPIAEAIIWHPAFAEKTRNRAKSGELGSLECSIIGAGISKEGEIDGVQYNIVDSIESGQAVDFVPRAGAGGRAVSVSESATEPEPRQVAPETKAPPETKKPILEKTRVLSVLRETNLPRPSQDRLAGGEYGDAAALAQAIVQETEYVKSVSGSGQPLGGGATQPTAETQTIEQRHAQDAEWYNNLREGHGLSPR